MLYNFDVVVNIGTSGVGCTRVLHSISAIIQRYSHQSYCWSVNTVKAEISGVYKKKYFWWLRYKVVTPKLKHNVKFKKNLENYIGTHTMH